MSRLPFTFALLLSVPLAWAGGAPTIDQSLNLRTAANPAISPDGRMVAYEVNKANWEENAFETEIWIATTDAPKRTYALTAGKKSSGAPQWSPDGRAIAFGSDRDGKRQIYVISPSGGEARQVTKGETAVAGFKWSPDGKAIAYAAPDSDEKPIKDRKEKYGEFEIVRQDYTRNHLWLQPLEGAATRLTEGAKFSVSSFSWSPDGTRIAFTATPDATPNSSRFADIYMLIVATKEVKPLVTTKGGDTNPQWSPDGKTIAFQTAAGGELSYKNTRVAVVPAAGGEPRMLTASFDEDPQLVSWTGRGIYFEGRQKTAAYLYSLNPETGRVSRLGENDGLVYSQASVTPDGNTAAFHRAGSTAMAEICVSGVERFRPEVLTAMSEQVKDMALGRREVVSWKSKDGTTIEGVLIKPVDFDATRKYPLLVVIHGGPTGVDQPVYRPDRYYPVEQFVAKGALVLRPNYRGSAGYGEEFRSLNVRNLGTGDAWDVLSGVDALIAKGFVDATRMGCMGWSQGGYISAFLTTTSDRFQAISVGAGISNWSTYYVNTDITNFTPQYLGATPWSDPGIYKKTSPITYVKQAKTPTLIQHGELDKRVPIPNGYELRQALEDGGVPVKMIVYKGFGHGIDKPKQQRAVMEHNMEWFTKYIWTE